MENTIISYEYASEIVDNVLMYNTLNILPVPYDQTY